MDKTADAQPMDATNHSHVPASAYSDRAPAPLPRTPAPEEDGAKGPLDALDEKDVPKGRPSDERFQTELASRGR